MDRDRKQQLQSVMADRDDTYTKKLSQTKRGKAMSERYSVERDERWRLIDSEIANDPTSHPIDLDDLRQTEEFYMKTCAERVLGEGNAEGIVYIPIESR